MIDAAAKKRLNAIKTWLGSGSINIFGLPFSGKDTQARLLSKALEAPVIAGGDILRSHPDKSKIKRLMATGKLFPSSFYLQVILPCLSQASLAGSPIILSSVGRWHGEEDSVMTAASKAGHPIKAVVFLNIPEQVVRQRYLSSQQNRDRGVRYDDAAHVIDVRLKEFRQKTLPVIEYYRNRGLLLEVDGSGPRNKVAERVIESLYRAV